MDVLSTHSVQELKYLRLLSESFPTCQAVYSEVINLEAILNLPKGTEHFMSDVHGEYEAFLHILNNCSGVIREHVRHVFGSHKNADEQDDLCTIIYYPREKLSRVKKAGLASPEWYKRTIFDLVRLARYLSNGYTRSKVRKAMPADYAYIIDELFHVRADEAEARMEYHNRIFDAILKTGAEDDFVESLAELIKRLAVDHLHLVGDIYDRGPHADRIMDHLMEYHSLDIQWGNHDIVWMGAAGGSEVCQAAVLRTNIRNKTLDILESAYGISLRELALFAERTYNDEDDLSQLEKAISVILFKLEGQTIMRHPNFQMESRLLLDKVDPARGVVTIDGVEYEMRTRDFPTLDPEHPYELSEDERKVMDGIMHSFKQSEKLQRHATFLYDKGSVYLVTNGNVLFHGCVPLNDDGTFQSVLSDGRHYSGKAYLDYVERMARQAWHNHRPEALDWMWYLWQGKHSPLAGRETKTFERTYLTDRSTWTEPEDPYFQLVRNPSVAKSVLEEFGLTGPHSHIINGHTPVHVAAGETAVHADGLQIIIDGGFCEAYHKTTGIAGYTLIFTSKGIRLKAHRPFSSVQEALDSNDDIASAGEQDVDVVEGHPLTVNDVDTGKTIRRQIADLMSLLECYRSGELSEHES